MQLNPPRPPLTPADRVVWFVSIASVVWFVVFVIRHATRVPFFDEFSSFRFLFGSDATSLSAYWEQHNEHRIPLPRLLYVLAVRAGGFDFRMPIFLNALFMIAITAVLLVAVRRVRGRTSMCDALIPLVVLSTGQHENLTWGFQIQFILSVAMLFGVLALVVNPEFSHSTWRVALAGLLSALQPLCGANGVAFSPALGAMFLVLGVRSLRSGYTRAGLLGVLIGLAVWALVPVYFHGLKPMTDQHPPASSLYAVFVSFVNLMGLGLGPVTHLVHPLSYPGMTVVGVVMTVLVAVTGVMLIRAALDPERRSQALAIGALLGAELCLAAGLAHGRTGMGSMLSANRYVTLSLPIPVVIFFAWVVCGRGTLARVVPAALCLAVVAGAYSNIAFGLRIARYHTNHLKPLSFDVNAGIPLSFLADKYRYVFSHSTAVRYDGFALLAQNGVKPFDRLAPDPQLTSVPVPLRVTRTENLDGTPAEFRTVGDHGYVDIALPQQQRVFGFRIVYEAHYENPNLPGNVLSWDPKGEFPPVPSCAVVNQLGHTYGPTTSHVFVNGEADHLRIDMYGSGSRLKIHELHVLTRGIKCAAASGFRSISVSNNEAVTCGFCSRTTTASTPPGLRTLRHELMKLGTVTVVAPATEQSAAGHSVTLLNPLLVSEVFEDDGKTLIGWAVEGRPADCVKLALLQLLPEPPDIIISGMNAGSNAGINVLYSGTVAAAIEGAFYGNTAIAVSLEYDKKIYDFPTGAKYARIVIEQILAHNPPKGSLINVNIPVLERGPVRGIKVLPQNVTPYSEQFDRRVNPRGRTYFWTNPDFKCLQPHPDTDVDALNDNFITVTPLQFDLTHHAKLAELQAWDWQWEG